MFKTIIAVFFLFSLLACKVEKLEPTSKPPRIDDACGLSLRTMLYDQNLHSIYYAGYLQGRDNEITVSTGGYYELTLFFQGKVKPGVYEVTGSNTNLASNEVFMISGPNWNRHDSQSGKLYVIEDAGHLFFQFCQVDFEYYNSPNIKLQIGAYFNLKM